MNKIKNIYIKYKKIIKNMWWLYLIQGANYIFPLLTIPYLMRTIGIEYYGLIAIMQSVMGYLNVIIDYGFNLTATRTISLNKNDKLFINNLFNEVMSTKIVLMILSFIVFFIGILFTQDNRLNILFYLYSFSIVIANTLFPVFLFQGIEDMFYISLINVIARIINLPLLFICVNNTDDYIYVGLIQGISAMLASTVGLYFIKIKYKFNFNIKIDFMMIKKMLKEGRAIFIANCCGNVYVQGSTIIVGILSGSTNATYFSLANKISGTMVSLFQPFVQAIYPDLCQKYERNKNEFVKLLKKLSVIILLLILFSIMAMHILSPYISYILSGTYDNNLILSIKVISFVLAGTVLNVFLHPFILALGKFNIIEKIYLNVSVIFLIISIPLTYFYNHLGMMGSLMIVEYSICVCYILILRKMILKL